ncbi:MAG: hypothetical protein WCR51_09860 [Planctomycetia bacterium]
MRLTVRTLLAWLDHMLPSDVQHELSDKVAASAPAQQLVARIRQVVERPTIPAPRVDGRGLAADPNSVAEYLDNCLAPDRLEAFERICVESDMHLAEVAACHEILATVAREPAALAPLDAAGRRRLLEAMGHQSATVFADIERREAASNARALRSAIEPTPGGTARPVPRRRAAWAAWAAAVAAATLLVALGVVLVDAIGRSRVQRGDQAPGGDQALAPAAAVAAGRPAAAIEPVEPVPHAGPASAPARAEPADDVMERQTQQPVPPAVPEAAPPNQAAAVAAADQPPAASPPVVTAPVDEAPLAVTPAASPRVPQGDALAIAAAAPPTPAAAPAGPDFPTAKPSAPAPAADRTAFGLVEGSGLVVHRTVAQGRPAWEALERGAALGPREDMIAPVGCQPDITVGGVTIRLLPATRAIVTADAGGMPKLEVVFGRAIVRAGRPDAQVGITAGGLEGAITNGLDGQAAIVVDLDRAPGSDPAVEPARVRASVVAVHGGLVWRQTGRAADGDPRPLAGLAAEGMLDARTAIAWESVAAGVGKVARLDPLPAWIGAAVPVDKLERNAAESLSARVLTTGSLDEALRDLASDRRVENRMLAASTLALLGDFDAAVDLLCTEAAGRRLEQRQWTKLEAEVVPLALARGANAAGKLRTAFESRGPHGTADTLFAMACGFTDAELAAGAADTLVAGLEDGDLVVRRYAFKCLCDIVQPAAPDRLRYRPDGLPDLRREGAAWWRGQLQKGLIRRPGAA